MRKWFPVALRLTILVVVVIALSVESPSASTIEAPALGHFGKALSGAQTISLFGAPGATAIRARKGG